MINMKNTFDFSFSIRYMSSTRSLNLCHPGPDPVCRPWIDGWQTDEFEITDNTLDHMSELAVEGFFNALPYLDYWYEDTVMLFQLSLQLKDGKILEISPLLNITFSDCDSEKHIFQTFLEKKSSEWEDIDGNSIATHVITKYKMINIYKDEDEEVKYLSKIPKIKKYGSMFYDKNTGIKKFIPGKFK